MIEPTESEPKAELDRFCTAMLGDRRGGARRSSAGEMDRGEQPARSAPAHRRGPGRRLGPALQPRAACYPPGAFRVDKYWAPVNRVDNAWGDRNLVCSCPPVESYREAAE